MPTPKQVRLADSFGRGHEKSPSMQRPALSFATVQWPLDDTDLPRLNGTTSRAITWWCQNQRRAFNATRKETTGRADHPLAARDRNRGGAK